MFKFRFTAIAVAPYSRYLTTYEARTQTPDTTLILTGARLFSKVSGVTELITLKLVHKKGC